MLITVVIFWGYLLDFGALIQLIMEALRVGLPGTGPPMQFSVLPTQFIGP